MFASTESSGPGKPILPQFLHKFTPCVAGRVRPLSLAARLRHVATPAEALKVAQVPGIAAPVQGRHVVGLVSVASALSAAPVVTFQDLRPDACPSALVERGMKPGARTAPAHPTSA